MSNIKDIPIAKTFTFKNEFYFYDTYSNQVYNISKQIYLEICEL